MGFRVHLSVEDVCPRAQLPSSWKTFLAEMRSKDRHEIKRKINKIRREVGDYRYCVTTPLEFDEDMEAFLKLHRKSDTQKTAFMDWKKSVFFKEMAWILLQERWLELSFLEANGSKLAALLNFNYGDAVYVYNSGYDPEFGHWSPGWVLISHSIQEAIERGAKTYDFLRGNESYKYRFRAKDFEIYRYTVQRREEPPQ
jgi:CelD/BcsL family acetyltransferase involved in cellulose biosynthesis